MSKKDKKRDNQFKKNSRSGEGRTGRLSEFKNHSDTEAAAEYEYRSETDIDRQMKDED